MEYKEKLKIENERHQSIIVWKSNGKFYEALNFSAFAFVKCIKDYKPNIKGII